MIQKCSNWIVLKEFLDNPEKKMYIRQLSRKIDLAPTSVRLHIRELLKENLILERRDELYKHYIANFDDEKFRFYKKIGTLIKLEESGLIRFLDERFSPDAIVLFGSCAKGEDTGQSDIDIYLQAKEGKVSTEKYEKILKRRIQLFFSEDLAKLPKELRNNVLNGIKLHGYLRVFP